LRSGRLSRREVHYDTDRAAVPEGVWPGTQRDYDTVTIGIMTVERRIGDAPASA
jgi:hypothetical protein